MYVAGVLYFWSFALDLVASAVRKQFTLDALFPSCSKLISTHTDCGKAGSMGDGPARIEIFPNHFQAPPSSDELTPTRNSAISQQEAKSSSSSHRHIWAGRQIRGARSMLRLFSLSGLHRTPSIGGNNKVELTSAELESLRSEITGAEERETYLKAQLENVDQILRSARLAGYLYVRTRWTTLPGEPPILDDNEVDDWLPRFVVLSGSCIFYYLKSTDLSPQDTTLLSDVSEVGLLPSIVREDQETRYAFYILTCRGLRIECSSHSKVQVDSWLSTLQTDCSLDLPCPIGLVKL